MTRHGVRLLTAALVAGSAALGFMPVARADTTTTSPPATEGWYQPNPSCTAPIGCLTPDALPAQPPTTSPFPARTLHVGYTSGQETARTYLALPTTARGASMSAGHLTVPLDTATADGDSSSATAKVQVCLTFVPVVAVDGSFDAVPKVDCTASAPMTYVPMPQPHLEADLGSLLERIPTATGLALLPDSTAGPGDSWRVVFSAHDRTDAAKTAPASIVLTAQDQPVPALPAPVTALPGVGAPPVSEVAPPSTSGLAPAPGVDLPAVLGAAPQVVLPPAAAEPPAQAPVTTQPTLVRLGYAYPGVWLLPLGFLLLVPTIARALTRDLTPVPSQDS